MKAWFDDPQQLIRSDQITQFWPTGEQTPVDRINAASRFIIYASCMIYLIRRDPRIFVLGATVLSVIYILYKSKMINESYGFSVDGEKCHMPTKENPMANVLITDFTDAPNRLEACYYSSVKPLVQSLNGDRVPFDAGRSRSHCPSINEMRLSVSLYPIQSPIWPVTRQGSLSGYTDPRTVPCVRVIPNSVARMPVVSNSKRSLVSVGMETSGGLGVVVVCEGGEEPIVRLYSHVIINGVSTPTWPFSSSEQGCHSSSKSD